MHAQIARVHPARRRRDDARGPRHRAAARADPVRDPHPRAPRGACVGEPMASRAANRTPRGAVDPVGRLRAAGRRGQEVMDAGARMIHVDVMDGHFVPPITIGPLIVERAGGPGARRRRAHRRAPDDRAARAPRGGLRERRRGLITVHWESTPHVHYALKTIREAGCRAGLAINPATPPEAVTGRLGLVRHPALHDREPRLGRPGVHPGLARQGARACARCCRPRGDRGGRRRGRDHRRPCREAGARLFVAGSAVFGTADPAEAYRQLATAAGAS